MRTLPGGPNSRQRLFLVTVLTASAVVACSAGRATAPPSGVPTSPVTPALATASPTAAAGSLTPTPSASGPSLSSPSASAIPAADLLAQCPPGSASREPTAIVERAEEGAFTLRVVHAPSCTPIRITFTNLGALLGVFHNIAIPHGDEWLFRGPPASSTSPVTYTIPPLPAGEYPFLSEARPSMGGSFVIVDQPAG